MLKKAVKLLLTWLLIGCLLPVQAFQVKAAEEEGELPVYKIYPIPQEIAYATGTTTLEQVNIVVESGIDQATRNHIQDVLNQNGIQAETSSAILPDKVNILLGIRGSEGYVDSYAKGISGLDSEIFDKTDAYMLNIQDSVITILGKDTDAAFYGVTTLKSILKQAADHKIRNLQINDYSDAAYRGFIEGFYGLPYSNENRMDLMEFCSDLKMNTYIFAPKDDPYHNTRWREPYPQDVLENKMKPLIEKGTQTKTRFIYAIHPFMYSQMTMEGFDADIQLVINKFEQMYQLGVRQFALLADDAYSATEVQIKAINTLDTWVKGKEGTYPLAFCPQNYSGDPTWSAAYFQAINAGISKEVQIMHTGPAIIGNVDQENNDKFISVAGRKPYLWLNWPVNDYTDSTLFLGKAEMLKPGVDNFTGLVSNPMCEAQLSKIGLFQIADYAWNRKAFDVDQSWKDSFGYVEPQASADLAELAKHMSYPRDGVYHQTGLAWEESEELAVSLQEFETKLKAGEGITEIGEHLIQEFEKIKTAGANVMEKSQNQSLKGELSPYLESLNATLDADLNIVQCALDVEKGDINGAWEQYSNVAGNIQKSDSVTKPGFKPEGYVNLEVKPGTKYLRPFARKMSSEMGMILKEAIGLTGGSGILELTPYVKIAQWNPSDGDLAALCDGDANTVMRFESGIQSAGDYYGLDLGTVSQVNHISILQGSSDTDHDIFHYGVIESSVDEKSWTTIKDYTAEAAGTKIEADANVKARYIRFRLTDPAYGNKPDFWLHVREMSVELGSDVEAFTNMEIPAVITDENGMISLKAEGAVTFENGDYIGIKLPYLTGVTVVSEAPEGLTVQVSENAKNWENATKDSAAARYIRVINQNQTAAEVNPLELVLAVDTITAPVVNTNGTMIEGNPALIFDGNEATKAVYKGTELSLNLGQSVLISQIDLSVAEDVADTRLPGDASIQLSQDGENWTTVREYHVTDKNAFDQHQVPYFYIKLSLEQPVQARYIRILNAEEKEISFNEIIVNQGQELLSTASKELTLTGAALKGYGINKASDQKLDTYYRANATEEKGGTITYRFNGEEFPKEFVVVQNANTISDASVEIQKLDGTWSLAGTLNQSVNTFDLSKIPNARGARISWEEQTPEFYLYEILYRQMGQEEAITNVVSQIQQKDYADYREEDVSALKDCAQRLQEQQSTMNAEAVAKAFEELDNMEKTLRPKEPEKPEKDQVLYQAHVQDKGWGEFVSDGEKGGTTGKGLSMEAIRIKLDHPVTDGGIEYQAHVKNKGWLGFVKDGELAGTTGKGLRMEAIQIRLTGKMADTYDVYYRAHIANYGWLGWTKNGEKAGSSGLSKGMEAIEIKLVEKGQEAPGSTDNPYMVPAAPKPMVSYESHVQDFGWQKTCLDGQLSGTVGKGRRMEGIRIKLDGKGLKGNIQYRTHVEKQGWQDFVGSGQLSGTTGKKLRIEAIRIMLTGDISEKYDVYYRTHVQEYGWLDWAKNGETSGTVGESKRMEAIEIKLVEKGQPAPGKTAVTYRGIENAE